MLSTFQRLRLIHTAFVFTWFMYIGLVVYLQLPEKPVPPVIPVALGVAAVSSISVARILRQKLLVEPARTLVSDPENAPILRRWVSGNIVSFAFAESIVLFGVVLRFLGERWRVAAIFFGAGLLLLLFWAPRKIEALPRGVR